MIVVTLYESILTLEHASIITTGGDLYSVRLGDLVDFLVSIGYYFVILQNLLYILFDSLSLDIE